jgi:hypothetical protein
MKHSQVEFVFKIIVKLNFYVYNIYFCKDKLKNYFKLTIKKTAKVNLNKRIFYTTLFIINLLIKSKIT